MIRINLLPGARKGSSAARPSLDFSAMAAGLSGRFKDKFLVAAVAGVLVAAGATAFLYLSQSKREADLAERQEKAVADSTRYANFLKDRYRAEAVRDTLLREVNVIRSLDDDRYVWPHIMDEISRALPQYTWLTMVAYSGTPQGQGKVVVMPKNADSAKKASKAPKRLETDIPKDPVQVRLTGRTVDIQALTRFMKDLEASPYLGNVQLQRSEIATDQGKEVTQFELLLDYTRPDSTVLHRVPVSITGLAAAAGDAAPPSRTGGTK